MQYQNIYDRLIESARSTPHIGYTEKHHIIPKSMGGTDNPSNIVLLSAKQHFVAHHLLWKIYRNREMTKAFMMMCSIKRDGIKYRVYAKDYQLLKEDNKKFRSEFMKGRIGNNHGRRLSQEWRDNISKAMLGNDHAVGNTSFKGKTHKQSSKDILSKKLTGNKNREGCKHTEETKEMMRKDRKGKTKVPWTEERREARRLLLAGKKRGPYKK